VKPVSLHDLYLLELRDLYDGGQRIAETLPEMAEAANATDLKLALEAYLAETRSHLNRLEEIFRILHEKPKRRKCKGMLGIIAEGEDLMDEDATPVVADAALIAAAQKMVHYEIAAYGAATNWARQLGLREQAELLQRTFEEEANTGRKLTALAESHINEEARSAS
jgi:ferritin-like metal-binding protein YciE